MISYTGFGQIWLKLASFTIARFHKSHLVMGNELGLINYRQETHLVWIETCFKSKQASANYKAINLKDKKQKALRMSRRF